ncbi:hypothetical protein ACQCN2_13330 [Brevibacillus ginsengisoli]|uniref:hypothetical protein n=1 Tax=Brevibacillus ginsengisoli TaxID=363854 RepID=UPI003CF3F4C1
MFNYTMHNIKVKSNWFDFSTSTNKFKKMGYKGFNLYLTLFKFRLYKQEHNYMFVTSISLLRKETGYATEEILELLKVMKKIKIIHIDNVSRWDYMMDGQKIKDDKVLVMWASDVPNVEKVEIEVEEKGFGLKGSKTNTNTIEKPVTEDDYYVNVDLSLLQYYEEIGLNERYYPLYCLIRKMTNNPEKKSWMSIEKMAETLEYDKDTLNKMVHEMNRKYLLLSTPRDNGKNGKYFENKICTTFSSLDQFKQNHQEEIDKRVEKWDKKLKHKGKKKNQEKEKVKPNSELDNSINENDLFYEYLEPDVSGKFDRKRSRLVEWQDNAGKLRQRNDDQEWLDEMEF